METTVERLTAMADHFWICSTEYDSGGSIQMGGDSIATIGSLDFSGGASLQDVDGGVEVYGIINMLTSSIVLGNASSAPDSPLAGKIDFDTDTHTIQCFDGMPGKPSQ